MKSLLLTLLCIFFIFHAGCAAVSGEWPQAVSPAEASKMLEKETDAVLLDVRTEDEFDSGHIPGSILLPLGDIKDKISNVIPDKDTIVIIYCRSGNRSKTAAELLVELGYKRVYDLGGIIGWPYEITG